MLDTAALAGAQLDAREVAYGPLDAMLLALALGVGADPLDVRQLRYVTEPAPDVFPTLPLVLGYPGIFIADPHRALDYDRMLHAEERLELHRPLPPAGVVRDRTVVDAIVDRGVARGAFVHTRKELHSENDGLHLATVRSAILCRGDGGGGSAGAPPAPLRATPDRQADGRVEIATLPQQALLYRLCGDSNPVHADPARARLAGFTQPLLHGRCTLGHAVHALLRDCLDYDASRIAAIEVRFSAPFFPGETLAVDWWKAGPGWQFTATAIERAALVLSHGLLQVAA